MLGKTGSIKDFKTVVRKGDFVFISGTGKPVYERQPLMYNGMHSEGLMMLVTGEGTTIYVDAQIECVIPKEIMPLLEHHVSDMLTDEVIDITFGAQNVADIKSKQSFTSKNSPAELLGLLSNKLLKDNQTEDGEHVTRCCVIINPQAESTDPSSWGSTRYFNVGFDTMELNYALDECKAIVLGTAPGAGTYEDIDD